MKGAIFNLFEDFVTSSFGPDAFEDLLEATKLETSKPFVGPGTYPAGDLFALVSTAVTAHGMTIDELLQAFGRSAFPGLARSVAPLLEGLDTPYDLLVNLESLIHTEVRKLDPEAHPARFTVADVAPNEILLHYESPYGLFGFVEGLLAGLGDWYQTPVHCELLEVAGTNATFKVRFGQKEAKQSPDLVDGAGLEVELHA